MESGEDLCLLICDIDHFKKFNDNYGHQTGDQVLKLAGMILTQNVKGRDTAARYGGEEFAIILPNTPLDAECNLANKVREAVASKRIRKKIHRRGFRRFSGAANR
jgi:diguanylate cyclase